MMIYNDHMIMIMMTMINMIMITMTMMITPRCVSI